MKGAVEQQPAAAGIQLANWSLRQAQDEGGAAVCLRTVWHQPVPQQLPELASPAGVCLQAPKKRLVKGNESKREAFVAEYAALWEEAQRTEARIFFADEAHFRADAELRGKWVLKGKPALVDSNSPRYGEKASYYSAVCLETGEVEWMELEGNSNSGTSVAFLTQLKEKWKRPRTRAKGLLAAGIGRYLALGTAYGDRGYWRVAGSQSQRRTLPGKVFRSTTAPHRQVAWSLLVKWHP